MMFGQRNYTQETYASNSRKSCGSPPKDLLAITYNEGIPLDFEKNHRYFQFHQFLVLMNVIFMMADVQSTVRFHLKVPTCYRSHVSLCHS